MVKYLTLQKDLWKQRRNADKQAVGRRDMGREQLQNAIVLIRNAAELFKAGDAFR